jgi:multiple sugar transport system permease protein
MASSTTLTKSKPGNRSGLARQRTLSFYLFIAPWLLGFVIFTAGPILAALAFSFTNYDIVTPPQFVGLGNYRRLWQDPLFGISLYNTLYYVWFAVPLGLITSLLLAVLLNQKVRGTSLYRTLFYLPSIVPTVANSLLWLWLLNPQWGLINSILRLVGIDGPLWLASANWSKPALILMSVWGSGATMVIFLAGLQGIPEQLYEAAAIDGANRWQSFWRITLPLMTPTIFFNLVLGIIGSFQVFTQAYIMTNGGPLDSTLFYMLYLFRQAFSYLQLGYASAMAWILFLIISGLTYIQFKLAPRWVHYE